MARDRGLEELVRGDLPRTGFTEKAMFGGWAWLLNGNLVLGARVDGLLVRIGKGNDAWALEIPGVANMVSAGREMTGWVRAAPDAFGDDHLRKRLIDAAVKYVRDLPPK